MKDLSKLFVAALKEVIKDEPRGAKTRLAKTAEISTGMLGDILAERAYGSEETKRALAAALGYPGPRFEEFLQIGRDVQAGREPGGNRLEYPSDEELAVQGFMKVDFQTT